MVLRGCRRHPLRAGEPPDGLCRRAMREVRSPSRQLDWNDVRFFLAVARRRTLARAAALLGVDQTTVGRRIASLESKLRLSLFTRSAGVFQVSRAGRGVL